MPHIACQPHLKPIAQAKAIRLHIDLNAACLAGCRVILDPRHRRSKDQQGIAALHRPKRRVGAEVADQNRDARARVQDTRRGIQLIAGGTEIVGSQEDDVRAPGLRIDRLSADRFIICTSLVIVR